MKRLAMLLLLALALPVAAQESARTKPARKPSAHSKPTPQQIRKFDELEKKEEKAEKKQRQKGGGTTNSAESPSQKVRAPSPK